MGPEKSNRNLSSQRVCWIVWACILHPTYLFELFCVTATAFISPSPHPIESKPNGLGSHFIAASHVNCLPASCCGVTRHWGLWGLWGSCDPPSAGGFSGHRHGVQGQGGPDPMDAKIFSFWVNFNHQESDRRSWSMFPLTDGVPFGVPIFDPRPM